MGTHFWNTTEDSHEEETPVGNVSICDVPIGGNISQISFDTNDANISISICVDDGTIVTMRDSHPQSCYEMVYADWEQLEPYIPRILASGPYEKLTIRGVSGMGILLVFDTGSSHAVPKIFIPGYNDQNGCYSSDLSLIISSGGEELEFDISSYLESCGEQTI